MKPQNLAYELVSPYKPMATIKPMEIAFNDIKYIIINILHVECHCVLFNIWVSECPKYR